MAKGGVWREAKNKGATVSTSTSPVFSLASHPAPSSHRTTSPATFQGRLGWRVQMLGSDCSSELGRGGFVARRNGEWRGGRCDCDPERRSCSMWCMQASPECPLVWMGSRTLEHSTCTNTVRCDLWDVWSWLRCGGQPWLDDWCCFGCIEFWNGD